MDFNGGGVAKQSWLGRRTMSEPTVGTEGQIVSAQKMQLAVEELDPRLVLAGITVISHGFQTSAGLPDWTVTLGQAILDRADGSSTSRDVGSMFVHDPGSGIWQPISNSVWNNSNRADEHIVLLYDWSAESGIFEDGWLAGAADNLFANLVRSNANLSGQLADSRFIDVACTTPLEECTSLDLHFIGHSRGAVMNSLVTERFATYYDDLMIEQVTSLDPHPASFMNDPGYVSNDPSANSRLFTYENVTFADNYFRQDLFYELDGDFDGVFAEGAFNLQIPESVLAGGSTFEHLDVHTWYYGTVTEPFDPSYSGFGGSGRNNDGDVSFPETWYGVQNVPSRDMAGFHFSAIGGGDPSSLTISGLKSAPAPLSALFNGDFVFGNSDDQVPGWSFHDGFVDADFTNQGLVFSSAGNAAAHNLAYVPANANELRIRANVVVAAANDNLEIRLGSTLIGALDLNQVGPQDVTFAMPAGIPHQALQVSLELQSSVAPTSNVVVEEVAFSLSPGSQGDFNNDGALDCADIDQLVAAIAGGSSDAIWDVNLDGLVDALDLNTWLSLAGDTNLPSGNAYLSGDANLDGVVDGEDFLIWNDNKFTTQAAWCRGDFNADGSVDGQDFLEWNDNKFTSAAASPLAFPRDAFLPDDDREATALAAPSILAYLCSPGDESC